MLGYIILGVTLVLIYKLFQSPHPEPYLGVYQRPGVLFFVKKCAFFVLYKLRQRQNERQKSVSGQDAGYGKRSRSSVDQMDRVQPLDPAFPKSVDAVYFNAANEQGFYFVAATARRQEGLVQTLLYIRVPNVGLFELATLPNTSLQTSKPECYSAGGLTIEPVTPMKEWRLTFDGTMRLIKPDGEKVEDIKANFDLQWTADSRLFDFDTDMDVTALCEAMATEPWSREFFNNLKDAHQTHYEQFGTITGIVSFENYPEQELHVRGVRDHSYGNFRDWKDLHRYAIQYFTLRDGTAFCVGNICFPKTMSRLIIGYVMHPDGQMDTVSSTNLELWKAGEDGVDPDEMEFSFSAGGIPYHLKMEVLDRPIFLMGEDARIHERMCKFNVNGIEGWGISEWDYRIYKTFPEKKEL
ncbi:hypothetical protein CAPTEDRAFT_151881 [Capitella teleta]|uniref:DUF7064 domain-containing protein n=1 Tax=Capitella teleta TaxID=283909 RepID=R7V0T9_CAPTE|nr:hypothetical protein CAPTEDRAFT_151881 [Capitella teleta]|eukprot:ELU09306.1 hypothetical protein CAPTEDRAFT_151881 [Capitella teleta]